MSLGILAGAVLAGGIVYVGILELICRHRASRLADQHHAPRTGGVCLFEAVENLAEVLEDDDDARARMSELLKIGEEETSHLPELLKQVAPELAQERSSPVPPIYRESTPT